MRFSSRRVISALLGIAVVVAVAGMFTQDKQPAQATTSGPTSSGYTWFDSRQPSPSIPFSFIDISGSGTLLAVISDTDDDFSVVSLPFPFSFFGTAYSEAAVSTNGYLSFTTTGEESGCNENYNGNEGDYGLPIPSESCFNGDWPANPLIGAWIDDLDTDKCGSIYTGTQGSAPNRRFIVQWQDVCHYDCDTCEAGFGITFEIVLFEGTNDILVQYLDTIFEYSEDSDITEENAGGTATTGINRNGDTGLQYSLNEPVLSNGLAVCYTTSAVSGTACGLSTTGVNCLARGVYCPTGTPVTTATTTPSPTSTVAPMSTPTPTTAPALTPTPTATNTPTPTPTSTPTPIGCGLYRGAPPCTPTPTGTPAPLATPTATPTQFIFGPGR